MNKSELITRLTERLGGDRAAAVAAVNGVLAEIEDGVARGERVSLTGFGTFERRERAARTGRNPRTGAAIQVGPSVVPVFRAGAGFRTRLGQDGAGPAGHPEDPAAAAAAVQLAGRTVRVDVGGPAGSTDGGAGADGKGKGKKGKGKEKGRNDKASKKDAKAGKKAKAAR